MHVFTWTSTYIISSNLAEGQCHLATLQHYKQADRQDLQRMCAKSLRCQGWANNLGVRLNRQIYREIASKRFLGGGGVIKPCYKTCVLQAKHTKWCHKQIPSFHISKHWFFLKSWFFFLKSITNSAFQRFPMDTLKNGFKNS